MGCFGTMNKAHGATGSLAQWGVFDMTIKVARRVQGQAQAQARTCVDLSTKPDRSNRFTRKAGWAARQRARSISGYLKVEALPSSRRAALPLLSHTTSTHPPFSPPTHLQSLFLFFLTTKAHPNLKLREHAASLTHSEQLEHN
jgi:hypothetical protein